MPGDPHDQAEELLPWYATGRLDGTDRIRFERHLSSCARCQRKLGLEHLLIDQVRGFAPEVESGWLRLRRRIEGRPRRWSRLAEAASDLRALLRRPAVAALAAGQLALLALGAWLLQPPSRPAYVALGSAEQAAAANILVMFRADAREAELRAALNSSGASLVGGPTAAGAYLLHAPTAQRPAALAKLAADRSVTLAQPIDGPAP